MSCTELYKIDKKGDISLYEEFGNSHLGAMYLWRSVFEQYKETHFPKEEYLHVLLNGDEQSKFWDLFKDESVPKFLRILLLNSYDAIMVKKEDFKTLLEAFKEYNDTFIEDNTNDHYLSYITAIEKLLEDTDCIGICWNQTSINCSPWSVYIDEDPETGEELPEEEIIDREYNIHEDDEARQYFIDLKNISD